MNQMSQMSQESIKEADVIEESELQEINISSQDTNKSEKQVKQGTNKVGPEISMAPWKALIQYEKRSQRLSGTDKQSQKLTSEPEILKKIKIKPVFIAETERTYKSRKQLPEALHSSESEIEQSAQSISKPIQATTTTIANNKFLPEQSNKSTLASLSNSLPLSLTIPFPQQPPTSSNMISISNNNSNNNNSSINSNMNNTIPNQKLLANVRKNRYRRKNYFFQDKMVKIKQLQLTKTTQAINIRGEIIFIWDKYNFNQKWANTQMICVQLYDDSGTVLLAIPNKIAQRRGWDLQIGKLIQVSKVQTRQKYPRKLCLLLTQASTLKILPSSLLSHSNRFFPQQHSLSLPQLQSCPVGQTISLICLILQKSPLQYIRSHTKNIDLTLCKILTYDPISNTSIWVKLWQQKTQIKFYCNAVIYLLRGIEIKEFKGIREYHASKEFNYREVSGTRVEEYLRNIYTNRNKTIEQYKHIKKEIIDAISIGDSMKNIQYQYLNARKSNQLNDQSSIINKVVQTQLKQLSKQASKIQKLYPQLPPPVPLSSPSIPSHDKQIYTSCSITTIKFLDIQLRSCYKLSTLQCSSPQCRAHIVLPINMEIARSSILCNVCKTMSSSSLTFPRYSVKCQVYDGRENYYAEIGDQAGKKLFTIQTTDYTQINTNNIGQKMRENTNNTTINSYDVPTTTEMKVQFLQCMNNRFRMMIGKDIIGDTVKAVILCTRQKIYPLHEKTQTDNKDDKEENVIKNEGDECWINGCYILDVLPFQEQIYQENSRMDSKEVTKKNIDKEEWEMSKNQSTRPLR